jgi:hypothetical protein
MIDPTILDKVITNGIEAYPIIIQAQMKADIIAAIVFFGCIAVLMTLWFFLTWIFD